MKDDPYLGLAPCLVRITDEQGNEIGQGKMDENGLVRGILYNGEHYIQQLTHLVVEDEV